MTTFLVVLLVLLVWDGLCWLVIGSLVAPRLPGGWMTIAAAAVLLLAPLGVLASAIGGGGYPPAWLRLWVFRPFWYGQLFLPVLALAGLAGAMFGLPFGAAGAAGRGALAAMAAVLLIVSVWGYLGTRRLVVRPVEAAFAELPAGLDGMRIVQLSDLHVGPHTSPRHLRRIREAVRGASPDLIVLTGDQVDDYARDVEPLGRALGELSAPLGVVAVPGNHDVYAGWPAVRRGMERLGWRVLVNDAVPLERGGARLWVAGTGDPAGRGGPAGADPSVVPDIGRTLSGVPSGEFTVVLAHNPALWPELASHGVPLTLSGHTHHGQLSIPRLGWSLASLFLEHSMGTYRRGGSMLYINPGTNFWGIPLRIGALPEVTVITLRRAGGSGPGSGPGESDPMALQQLHEVRPR
jgi:hypothetical protein